MAQWCRKYHVEIWAWCLMPNHVHLIAVTRNEEGLENLGQRLIILSEILIFNGCCPYFFTVVNRKSRF